MIDKAINYWSKHISFELILCGVLVFLFQPSAMATQSVGLAWNPETDTNVVAYRVYFGTASRNYGSSVTVNNSNSVSISGLGDGITYYFAITAIDSAGDESSLSPEVVYQVPSAAATLMALPGSASQFRLIISGVSGYQYVVQTSTNLTSWVSVQTNTSPFTFVDTNATQLPQCFYRAYYLVP